MYNQMPYNFGHNNNNCQCSGNMRDFQRQLSNLENRINRLENMIYSNNWNDYNNYNQPTPLSNNNREYTTGNYIL